MKYFTSISLIYLLITLPYYIQSQTTRTSTRITTTATNRIITQTTSVTKAVTTANISTNLTRPVASFISSTNILPSTTATPSLNVNGTRSSNTYSSQLTKASALLQVAFSLDNTVVPSPPPEVATYKYQTIQGVQTGAIAVWAGMAMSLRKALDNTRSIIVTNGEWSLLGGLTSNVQLVVSISICFLFAFVSIISVPFLAVEYRNFLKKAKELSLENPSGKDGKDASKDSKERGGRDAKEITKKNMDDEKNNEKLYSSFQRNIALLFLYITCLTSMSCMIIAGGGTAVIGKALNRLATVADLGMAELQEKANQTLSVTLQSRSPQSIDTLLIALQTYYPDKLLSGFYPKFYEFSQNMTGSAIAINNLTSIIVNDIELADQRVLDLQAEWLNFTQWLGSPSFLQTGIANCPLTATLPNLSTKSPPAVDFSIASQFSQSIPKTQSANFNNEATGVQTAFNVLFEALLPDVYSAVYTTVYSAASNSFTSIQLAYNNLNLALADGRYLANSVMGTLMSGNSARAVGAYIALGVGLPLCLISTGTIIFRLMKVARCINMLNMVLVSAFWVLCALTLGYSVFNSQSCVEARYNNYLNWTSQISTNVRFSSYSDQIKSFSEGIVKARLECFNNRSDTMFSVLREASVFQLQNDPVALNDFERMTIPSKLASELWSSGDTSRVSLYNKLAQDAQTMAIQLRTLNLDQSYAVLDDLIATELLTINFASLANEMRMPIFFKSTDRIISDMLNNTIIPWQNSLATNNFQTASNPSQCVTSYRALNFTSRLQAELISRINRVNQIRNDLLNIYSRIQRNVDSLRFNRVVMTDSIAKIVPAVGQAPLLQSANLQAEMALGKIQHRDILIALASVLDNDAKNTLSCATLAAYTYEAEDIVCGQTQIGYDASYWAFGALGVVYLMHFLAIRMCSRRLVDDTKWLLLAMLIRNSYSDNNTTVSSMKLKKNATGTTYLQESDLNVNF